MAATVMDGAHQLIRFASVDTAGLMDEASWRRGIADLYAMAG